MDSDWPATPTPFGKEMKAEFLLDNGVTFLNHCAKGAVPRKVFETQVRLAQEIEKNPEYYWKLSKWERWNGNLQKIADFLCADVTNLTFVENTTRGISNILTSYPFQEGDAILYNSFTHPVVKNQIKGLLHSKKELNLAAVEVQLELPCPGSDILQKYHESLNKHTNIRLVITDYVCGRPATMFPVQTLVDLCRTHGVHILVDAAHAFGLLPVQLDKLGADFIVGSFYKWLFCPRGCAIMYIHPLCQPHIKPSVLALHSEGPYPQPFLDQGTRDEVPYLCIGEALRFYHWLGGYDAMCAYNNPLADAAEELLSSSWGTSLTDVPRSELVPFLRNVRLPAMKAYSADQADCSRLGFDLYHRFHIWAGVFLHQDALWVRVAAQVYCTLDDFRLLRDAILELKQEDPASSHQMESR